MTFTGPCRGGPDDGKPLTQHTDEFAVITKKLVWPAPNAFPKYVTRFIGMYRFVDGTWVWNGANDDA